MIELTISKRNTKLFRHSLDDGTITVGRNPDSEIYLNSPSVSHEHARITFSEGTWFIEDLASKGGTLVNDKKVRRAQLSDNDVISVGHYKIDCSFKAEKKATNVTSINPVITEQPKDETNSEEQVEQNGTESSEADAESPAFPVQHKRPVLGGHVPPLHGTGVDVLTGPAQGKRIYFTRDSAALGVEDVTAVVIKSVEDGYIAQAPNEALAVTLNGDIIGEKPAQLDDGDLIAFSNLSARFFVNTSAE